MGYLDENPGIFALVVVLIFGFVMAVCCCALYNATNKTSLTSTGASRKYTVSSRAVIPVNYDLGA